MQRSDFPNYSQAASKLSEKSQQKYLNLIKTDLASMIVASALSIYNYQAEESKQIFYVLSGLLLLVSILLTLLLKIKKYEETWYQARGLAELCKNLTWRFVCRAEPFSNTLNETEATHHFSDTISDYFAHSGDISQAIDPDFLNMKLITPTMYEVRNMDITGRKEYYIMNRVEAQINWYTSKAKYNTQKYNLWLWIIFFSQAISIVCVLFLILRPSFEWNLVALFTTIAATALSWLQTKKHQELRQSYMTAASSLKRMVEKSGSIQSEQELSAFVIASENTMSKEHQVWIAKRNT